VHENKKTQTDKNPRVLQIYRTFVRLAIIIVAVYFKVVKGKIKKTETQLRISVKYLL